MNVAEQNEVLIKVNGSDQPIGMVDKLTAHQEGILHRAVSVFIFNSRGEVLLQQRAAEKYHSSSKWTNTCCTHPRPGESSLDAAKRRLSEEMGIDAELDYMYKFRYYTEFADGMAEHEIDHVFFGVTDEMPTPDPKEVSDWWYADINELVIDIVKNPEIFTHWFTMCMEDLAYHKERYDNQLAKAG